MRRRSPQLLSVLNSEEVHQAVRLSQRRHSMAELLYGTGLYWMECCGLIVKDVHLERSQNVVWKNP